MIHLPQITTRNEIRILNWGHMAQIAMVLVVIILAFVKIGSGNVRGRSDVWGLSVVSHFTV
jgi:low affinity Fe/Cu permease